MGKQGVGGASPFCAMFQDLRFVLFKCDVLCEENGQQKMYRDVGVDIHINDSHAQIIGFWKSKGEGLDNKEKFESLNLNPTAIFATKREGVLQNDRSKPLWLEKEALDPQDIIEALRSGKSHKSLFGKLLKK